MTDVSPTRLRVAIVDDEALARAVVREYLSVMPHIEVVAECANGFEAVKAVSDLLTPVAGIVTEVNATLASDPALVNRDPYGDGWMIKLRVKTPADIKTLLGSAEYKKHVGE